MFKELPQNFAVSPSSIILWELFTVAGLQTNSEVCSNSSSFAFGVLLIFQCFCVFVCVFNEYTDAEKIQKNSYSPVGHMNIALSKAVSPCSLKAKRRWNRCNMDFCSVSIHSVLSWANNLKCINHPMNVSFFSCSWKIQKQNLLATKSLGIKNILNWDSFQTCSHVLSIFLCDFFHISKDQHWYMNRSPHSTSRPLSSPYVYVFSTTKFLSSCQLRGDIHWQKD